MFALNIDKTIFRGPLLLPDTFTFIMAAVEGYLQGTEIPNYKPKMSLTKKCCLFQVSIFFGLISEETRHHGDDWRRRWETEEETKEALASKIRAGELVHSKLIFKFSPSDFFDIAFALFLRLLFRTANTPI